MHPGLLHRVLTAVALMLAATAAHAVPSFARQTGFECTTCHLSWPELTSVGRQFKLGGYTLLKETGEERPWIRFTSDGPPPKLPLAVMVQGSLTCCRRRQQSIGPSHVVQGQGDLLLRRPV